MRLYIADPIVLAAAGTTCALGLLAIVWVASAEKVGTVKAADPRPRCEAKTSAGSCRAYGNLIEHGSGVHYYCPRHASAEGWTR